MIEMLENAAFDGKEIIMRKQSTSSRRPRSCSKRSTKPYAER
jgi:hypothetical protein